MEVELKLVHIMGALIAIVAICIGVTIPITAIVTGASTEREIGL